MDRISRIHNIIRWQELYQEKKAILSIYEHDEIKLSKLENDFSVAQINKEKLEAQYLLLSEKIEKEEERLESILNRIQEMEQDRDNLKMARQVKSWEKEIEKLAQDREVLEAQLYYDKSRIGDVSQESETISNQLLTYASEISELEGSLSEVKAKTKKQRDTIEKEMEEISQKFDIHFSEYFNRILLKNKGVVMAVIENDSCSGCNILLPTSYHDGDATQDSEDSALLQCPNCFRYLYYNEDINQ